MTRIAHISDLHFGRHDPVVALGLLETLHARAPDVVAVSGDLTQRATGGQYRNARQFLNALPRPVLTVPGNHDIPSLNPLERFLFPWRNWRRFIGLPLEPTVHGEDFTAVGLNTVRRMGLHTDWSRGQAGEEQIETACRTFRKAPENALRVLVAHHPFWLPRPYRHRRLVGGAKPALQALQESGTDLILGGHVHSPFVHPTHGTLLSHAGTAISSRYVGGHRNEFSFMEGDRSRIRMECWEWNGREFVPASETSFKRTEQGWMPDS